MMNEPTKTATNGEDHHEHLERPEGVVEGALVLGDELVTGEDLERPRPSAAWMLLGEVGLRDARHRRSRRCRRSDPDRRQHVLAVASVNSTAVAPAAESASPNVAKPDDGERAGRPRW